MNMKRNSIRVVMWGAALAAACSGKLVVDEIGDRAGPDSGSGAGGAPAPEAGVGAVGQRGGEGGTAGCSSQSQRSAGGIKGTGGRSPWSGTGVPATCPLDAEGFATTDLPTLCGFYRCPARSADLLEGLGCDEVTTERTGFTLTVGCDFETVEFQSYLQRTPYELEVRYAASYGLATGELSGLVIEQPEQFGPCTSYAYRAGTVPSDCPSAVTYKCNRIPQGGAADDAYQGCRAPDEPGCERCCESPMGQCIEQMSDTGLTSYVGGIHRSGPCACDCKPCATCLRDQEAMMRTRVEPPDCDCSLPPTGEPCASHCQNQPFYEELCPGL